VNLAAFYIVAILSGHLAERLGQVGSELARRHLDLTRLRALNQNILDSVASGLCTLDLSDHIISFNPAAERIAGRPVDEVLGRPIEHVLPSLARELQAARAVGDDAHYRSEVPLERADGVRLHLGVGVMPLHDSVGNLDGHILHFADVTEVRRLRDLAKQQERMAAIGALAASIAHEVRNPMASISGALQVLREGTDPQSSPARLMNIALREIDRLNVLIEDFLTYARPQRLSLGSVDVSHLLEETALLLRQEAGIGQNLRIEVGPHSSPNLCVRGDANALRQVLWNLVRNAAEAMGGQGDLRISAAQERTSDDGQPAQVELMVADSGPGIPAEARDRLFEPFFTTKARGTGLGLATVHRIIEARRHDWVEDGPSGRAPPFTCCCRKPTNQPHRAPEPAPVTTEAR
jgi:two-component system sensor histidine kinase PilS (NtrC family)